jgi:hypothetical protein
MRTQTRKMAMVTLALGALLGGFGAGMARADVFDNLDLWGPSSPFDDAWAWGTVCDGASCSCDTQLGGESACADFDNKCYENDFDQVGWHVVSSGFMDRARPRVVFTCTSSRGRDRRRPDPGVERDQLEQWQSSLPSW